MNEKSEQTVQGPSFLTNPAVSLICFGGKGGVGKTTSAAATALHLANENPQKRILLASIDPAHSLMDSLNNSVIVHPHPCPPPAFPFIPFREGDRGRLVGEVRGGSELLQNLMVWEIDARASFRKFMERHSNTIKKIMERGTFLDNTDISALLSASLPGIDELMGMVELVDLLESDAYDIVILDTAPTGHTIKFLQMPHLIKKWSRLLDLMMEKHRYMSKLYTRYYRADDTDAFIKAFSNSIERVEGVLRNKSCEFVPVMLPETLCVKETRRFLATLREYKIPVKNIIVNRIYPVSNCSFCKEQYLLQRKCVDEMKRYFDGYNFLMIPLYTDEIHGKESLLMFAQAMTDTIPQNHGMVSSIPVSSPYRMGKLMTGEIGDSKSPPFSVFPLLPAIDETLHVQKRESINHFPLPKSTVKFLLFGGKGGVGKTTIASATAVLFSELYPEKRILLFSTDPAHSLADCLGVTIGSDGLFVKNNLSVWELDAEEEYEKLKRLYSEEMKDLTMVFGKRDTAINVIFEKEIIESFIDLTPPGLDEIMAIATIIDYIDKEIFDLFILDTAPTGHLIRFLEMPELVIDWLKIFFNLFLKYKNIFRLPKLSAFLIDLSKKIKKLLNLLRNGENSLFVPIAIPTEMAYHETSDLVQSIRNLKIPTSQMILNMIQPHSQTYGISAECALCTNKIAYEKKIFDNFSHLFPRESMYIINKQYEEVCGIKDLEHFGRKLYGYF
ncbi:MAG: putative anion-transporting ATPase [Candidatus Brocadia sinica]|nr:MAG: putative anion-transporting ATPase [Candidatus Brocadia sinica]